MATFTPDSSDGAPPVTSSEPLSTGIFIEREDPGTKSDEHPPASPDQLNHDKLSAPSTPPTSPDTRAPSTPHTPPPRGKATPTPLYRRFRREVEMSPATTPPRSPTPAMGRTTPATGRTTPATRRKSPVKRSESPTKQKLEVGLNGFHFVCELPMSKVTPKKGVEKNETTSRPASPVKMEVVGVEGKGTPAKTTRGSPGKTTATASSAKKGTPSRTLFSTPSRDAAKSTPTKTPFGTPLRSQAQGTPKKATPARLHFGTPLRNVATPQPDKQASPTRSIKMASRYVQGSPAVPRESRASNEVTDDGKKLAKNTSDPFGLPEAARPKPVKEKSYDIGGLMANLQVHKQQSGATKKNDSAPPTPLRRAARGIVVGPVIRYKKDTEVVAVDKDVEVPRILAKEATDESSVSSRPIPSAFTPTEGTADQSDAPVNIATEALPCPTRLIFSQNNETHLGYPPLLFPPPEPVKPMVPPSAKREVHFQASNPLSTPPKSKSSSTSHCVGTDPTVLLAMQQEMDSLKQSLSSSLGVPYEFPSYGPANEYELPVMSNSSKARRTLSRTTSNVTATSSTSVSSMSTVRASMLMDPKVSSGTPRSTQKQQQLTSQSRTITAKKYVTPAKPTPKASRKPVLAGGLPRSARKSVFGDVQPTQSSVRKAKPVVPSAKKSSTAAAPRPAIKKFVSATDIAGRVAGWNKADTKTKTINTLGTKGKKQLATPSKTTAEKNKPAQKESSTPEGSPAKLLSALTPTPIKTHLTHTPKKPSTTTPKRLLHKPSAHTPAVRKLMDPNAFRTPSKEIVGSLDEAIDRKIEEDRRRG